MYPRRRLVLTFCVSQSIIFASLTLVFPVLLVPIADDLAMSRFAVTGAYTISVLAGALAALPVGRLLDARGGRAVMSGGALLGAAAVFGWAGAQHAWQLYLAFAAMGFALAASTYEAAFSVLLAHSTREQWRSSVVVITTVSALVANASFPLTGWLEASFGWRNAVLCYGVAMLLLVVPAHLLCVPNARVHRAKKPTDGVRMRVALRLPQLWLVVAAFVLQQGAAAVVSVQVVAYLLDEGHSAQVAATIPILLGLVSALARTSLAPLTRRFGTVPVTVTAFAVQGLAAIGLLVAGHSVVGASLFVALTGLGMAVGVVTRPLVLEELFGAAQFASLLALVTAPTMVARAGLPLLTAFTGGVAFLPIASTAAVLGAVALALAARAAQSRTCEKPA